jgi:hypothetical protein
MAAMQRDFDAGYPTFAILPGGSATSAGTFGASAACG